MITTTMIFLGGLGAGAAGTTIAFLFVIHTLLRQRKGGEEETKRANAESIAALRERNEIGRNILSALESVIDKGKGTFRMVDVERGNVYKTHLGSKLSGAATTIIPGLKAVHAIITPACRQNRGNEGALLEAFARLKRGYIDIVKARSDAFTCHVALTIEQASSMEPRETTAR